MAAAPLKRVGFSISKSKQENLSWPTVVDLGRTRFGIEFVELDLHRPLEPQGPFHVLILKWNQQLAKVVQPVPDEAVLAKVALVKKYLAEHPECTVVDPIEAQLMIMKRDEVIGIFEALSRLVPGVKCPFSFTINEGDANLPPQLKFPVICKTIEAGGTAESHHMGIVFNVKGLDEFKKPILVQEYVNHSATIEKVFVIDDFIHSVRRPSLPDFGPEADRAPLLFNSQAFESLVGAPHAHDTVPAPETALLKNLAEAFYSVTKLSLFGFDLIRENGSGLYAVIDVNFFPGFDGVPDFTDHFLRLIYHRANGRHAPK